MAKAQNITDTSAFVDLILLRLGLHEFIQVFRDNNVDYEAFKQLSDDDLTALNLRIGDKAKIRKEIQKIQHEEGAGK